MKIYGSRGARIGLGIGLAAFVGLVAASGQFVPGSPSSRQSKGTITLAAGAGTAPTFAGAVCVCTDTTAVAAVKCSVAATTLSAAGTTTDVIAYHCL